MFPDHGCRGEVELGALPDEVRDRLLALPGEWLEYDPDRSRVVKRHAQPSAGPDLQVITGELVQILATIPVESHRKIPGGAFYVHASDTGQFVRLQVAGGGALTLQWASPDFVSAKTRPYAGPRESGLDPHYHRIDGQVRFSGDADGAARIEELAGSWEGLYPEGECVPVVTGGTVTVDFRALNLDAHLLIGRLQEVAGPGSLEGGFTVTAFGREIRPEESLKIVFENGEALVQHPDLWSDTADA